MCFPVMSVKVEKSLAKKRLIKRHIFAKVSCTAECSHQHKKRGAKCRRRSHEIVHFCELHFLFAQRTINIPIPEFSTIHSQNRNQNFPRFLLHSFVTCCRTTISNYTIFREISSDVRLRNM